MEYQYLGNSGLKVSILSLGYSTTGIDVNTVLSPEFEQSKFESMDLCIKFGINFFDTSEVYSNGLSEIILGKNLKQGGWDRDELVIATKLYPPPHAIFGNGRKRIRERMKKSLERLQLDNVDILYLHRPDLHTPILEQISVVNELLDNEQTYYWGTSEFSSSQIEEIYYLCEKHGFVPPIADQCQYNMLFRKTIEQENIPLFRNYKFGAVAYSPAAGGALSGKFNDGTIPPGSKYLNNFFPKLEYQRILGWRENNGSAMLKGLKSIAGELGCTQNQLALAWVLLNPNISSVLFGASSLGQISANLEAIEISKRINESLLVRIEALLINKPSP